MKSLIAFVKKMFCKHEFDIYGWGYNYTWTSSDPEDNYKSIIAYYKCKNCGKIETKYYANQFVVTTFERIHSDKHIF